MSREILFRGKRVDSGQWVYGAFVPDALESTNGVSVLDGFIRRFDPSKRKMETLEVDRETVGQYTGLTDKNGKRIFERDILRTKVYVHCDAAIVVYSEGCFWTHNPSGGNIPLFKYVVDMESGKAEDVEVVGNIYDDPELLKGGGTA